MAYHLTLLSCSNRLPAQFQFVLLLFFFCICYHYTTNWYNKEGVGVCWSQRLVCWWKCVSQMLPTVFKSSQWNMLHMTSCRCAFHNLCEAWPPKGSREMPLFLNYYISIYPVARLRDRGYTVTISDSSSLNGCMLTDLFSCMYICLLS